MKQRIPTLEQFINESGISEMYLELAETLQDLIADTKQKISFEDADSVIMRFVEEVELTPAIVNDKNLVDELIDALEDVNIKIDSARAKLITKKLLETFTLYVKHRRVHVNESKIGDYMIMLSEILQNLVEDTKQKISFEDAQDIITEFIGETEFKATVANKKNLVDLIIDSLSKLNIKVDNEKANIMVDILLDAQDTKKKRFNVRESSEMSEAQLLENYGSELSKAVNQMKWLWQTMKGTSVSSISEIWLDAGERLGIIDEDDFDKIGQYIK
jgi:hypothetical protein